MGAAATIPIPTFLPGIDVRSRYASETVSMARVETPLDAPTWRVTNNSGPRAMLVIPRRGFVCAFGGQTIPALPGTALLAGIDREFRRRPIDGRGECSDLWLFGDATLDEALHRRGRARHDVLALTPRPHAILRSEALGRYVSTTTRPDALLVQETALGLLGDLLSTAPRSTGDTTVRPTTRRAHARSVRLAEEHMAEHVDEPVALDDVARAASLSPLHFCRVFRERKGMTVHTYLTRLRCATALELLGSTDASTQEIALRVGLDSRSHFSVTFRRQFGRPPAAVRDALRAANASRLVALLNAATGPADSQDLEHRLERRRRSSTR